MAEALSPPPQQDAAPGHDGAEVQEFLREGDAGLQGREGPHRWHRPSPWGGGCSRTPLTIGWGGGREPAGAVGPEGGEDPPQPVREGWRPLRGGGTPDRKAEPKRKHKKIPPIRKTIYPESWKKAKHFK